MYTRSGSRARLEFFLDSPNFLTGTQPDSNKYTRQEVIKGGIAFSGAQINRMVHLVIAALGAVAVETQGLVGHELLGARVDGSTDGNARQWLLAWEMVRKLDSE